MIRILVQGHSLVLYRNTTMTVEINNALFASPNIEGDISFSFTLPVEGNEQILDFAHLPQTDKVNKLPCSVYCNSYQNWTGELTVQKTTRDSITAALIVNPYPEGFGKRKLTENHDSDIVISESREAHDQMWERFLVASVNDKDVKFAPFFNEEGYGSDNEDFGHWYGYGRPKIVNALWFDTQGRLIDSGGSLFSKAHNAIFDVSEVTGTDEEGNAVESTHRETNQLAFCPQIRIARIMEIWCRNAGYRLVNHIGEDFAYTYLQSQKSLDATKSQYGMETGLTIRTTATEFVSAGYHWCSSYWLDGHSQDEYVHNGQVWIPYSGWWELAIDCSFSKELKKNLDWGGYEPFNVMGPAATLAIYKGAANFAEILNGTADILYKGDFHIEDSTEIHIQMRKYIPAEFVNEGLKFVLLCECRHYAYQGTGGGYYDESRPILSAVWTQEVEELQMEIMFHAVSQDQQQLGFNIFRRRFNIPELLPEVANSAFLKTMLETMGLCYFVSAKTKTIELVPYTMLKGAKSLDLTDCELTRETETTTPEETLRTFRLAPVKDEEYNENLRLEDVEQQLPDAYANHEHLILRTETNTLYRAEKQEADSGQSWTEGWNEHSGNPDRLEIGSGDEESREPSVKIPHQRYQSNSRRFRDTDSATGTRTQLAVADFTVSSDLYNASDKPSEIILTQYRGFRKRSYYGAAGYKELKNEVMLPVWADGFALKAKGENSLGEKYVKPVLELLGHKTVTYKFRLPSMMMQAVEDLLRPSEREPSMQTRFLIVRNVKTVPKRITFQIDNDIDDTVLCQIEAVKVY